MKRCHACLRSAAVVLLLGVLAGCNGFLNISPGTGQRACTSSVECDTGDLCINGVCSFGNNGACWAYNPEGTCPSGSRCVDGVCTRNPVNSWCDCPADRGCLNGQCVDISEDTVCNEDRPNGACLTGQVCVAGTCVEITPGNICSSNRLNGLCPSGTGCVRGTCVPIAEDPCGPTNTDGLCPSGARCNTSGACEVVPCSPSTPSGACSQVGYACDNGTCKPIPCSQANPNGPCDDVTKFCSVNGTCIPRDTCAANGDCTDGKYCAVAGVCRPVGTCVDPGDCGPFFTCNGGLCARDTSCTDDTNCPSGEHCLNLPAGGQCGPLYACVDGSDCDAGAYCSAIGECAAQEQCFDNADCVGDRCNFTDCRCSTVNTCIDVNGCATTADCKLGERCGGGSCLPIEACNSNTNCGTNDCCDAHDQRCNVAAGLCIPIGRCRADVDCGGGLKCDLNDGTCSVSTPTTTCTRANEATTCPGKYCNSYGVCATGTRAAGDCTTPLDCPDGQICNASFKCELAASCGGEEFATTELPPNMLILLDRSGSMNERVDGNATCQPSNKRWNIAVNAISAVLADRDGHIRFGLSTYPSANNCGGVRICPSNDCTYECLDNNWNGCPVANKPTGSDNGNNTEPGYVDRIVGSTAAQINQFLSTSGPGGRTPTARALSVIADNPATYGLPAQNDNPNRDNYVLLLTDGDPNNSTAAMSCASSCVTQNGGCNDNCMVNLQLDRLRTLPKPIKTFTVGFAFSSIKKNLNCNAVHGGTSICDPPANTDTCDDNGVGPCYYNANSPQALVAALAAISEQISGCTFTMDQAPPDIDRLYIFTRDVVGGVPTGAYKPVSNNPSNADGYYTLNGLRIDLNGPVCDRVRAGQEKPVAVYGCPQPGG